MEGGGKNKEQEEQLPPGFRFHPTDEELIKDYLIKKITDAGFSARAMADVDLNKCEPWDLPGMYIYIYILLFFDELNYVRMKLRR